MLYNSAGSYVNFFSSVGLVHLSEPKSIKLALHQNVYSRTWHTPSNDNYESCLAGLRGTNHDWEQANGKLSAHCQIPVGPQRTDILRLYHFRPSFRPLQLTVCKLPSLISVLQYFYCRLHRRHTLRAGEISRLRERVRHSFLSGSSTFYKIRDPNLHYKSCFM